MKQNTVHTFNMLILTINTDGLFHNQFPMVNLNISKIFQCLHMPQGLPLALEQIKAGITSENLLNEICQIIYSFISTKEITKKSIQQYNEFNKDIIQNGYIFFNPKK